MLLQICIPNRYCFSVIYNSLSYHGTIIQYLELLEKLARFQLAEKANIYTLQITIKLHRELEERHIWFLKIRFKKHSNGRVRCLFLTVRVQAHYPHKIAAKRSAYSDGNKIASFPYIYAQLSRSRA